MTRRGGVAVCITGERGEREQRMREEMGKRRWKEEEWWITAEGNDISLRDVKGIKNEREVRKWQEKRRHGEEN